MLTETKPKENEQPQADSEIEIVREIQRYCFVEHQLTPDTETAKKMAFEFALSGIEIGGAVSWEQFVLRYLIGDLHRMLFPKE